MMKFVAAAVLAAGFLGAAANSPALAVGEKAAVAMRSADGKDIGVVTIVETMAGILLQVKLKGLPPGAHGFHIHETGKCEGDLSSAGEIYNPLGAKHGFLNYEGPMAGDLPNLIAGGSGEAEAEILSPFVTLSKEAEETLFDVDGATLIIFAEADDYISEPDTATGPRIACGVVAPPK